MRLSLARRLLVVPFLASSLYGAAAYTFDGLGITSLTFGGTEYADTGGLYRSVPVTYQIHFASAGDCGSLARTTGTTANTSTITFTTCPVHIVSTYSQPDANSVKIAYRIYNDHATDTITWDTGFGTGFFPLALKIPTPYTTIASAEGNGWVNGFTNNLLRPSSGGAASIDFFSDNFSNACFLNSAVTASTPDGSHDRWDLRFRLQQVNGPTTSNCSIPPSSSVTLNVYVRFSTDATATEAQLAPEAVTAAQAAYPFSNSWANRNTIGTVFLAEHTLTSSTNPRGYFNDPSCLCTTSATFNSTLASWTAGTITQLNLMTPKPQGVIVWDLEGQEFAHPQTYLGSPNFLSWLSPEMNNAGAADVMFASFRSAGYAVGVTIRTHHLLHGTTVPGSCTYNANLDYTDQFIDEDQTPGGAGRYYQCTSGGTYTAQGASQMVWPDVANTIAEAVTKITYANTRWGATLFYVDSVIWSGGQAYAAVEVWKEIKSQIIAAGCTNCLLIPEQETNTTLAYAAPYLDAAAENLYNSALHQFPYTSGFTAIPLSNVTYDKLTAGYATVSGTSVTVTSGAVLATDGSLNGATIKVNGVAKTISSVTGVVATLTTSATSGSGVPWEVTTGTSKVPLVQIGITQGTIYMFPAWYSNWTQAALNAIYATATPYSGSVSGSSFSGVTFGGKVVIQ